MSVKKILVSILIVLLTTAVCSYGIAFATSDQEKLNDINQQKKDVSSDMAELAATIKSKQNEIASLEKSINAKESEINATEQEITKTKQQIAERKDGLNKRLRTMYKNGSMGYLDVILSSGSITEFVSNLGLIQRIYKSDNKTLLTLKSQHAELQSQEAVLLQEKSELTEKKASAEEKQDALQADKDELQSQLNKLNKEAEAISREIAAKQDSQKVYTGGKFLWPTTSTMITSPFGFRTHPVTGIYTGHTGIDIGVGSGSPVYAAASGKVIIAGWYGGYGNAVVIDHGSGISTLYGHNSSLKVSVGEKVTRGQTIALSGSTGVSTGPHVHFEVRINGSYVNPMNYFS